MRKRERLRTQGPPALNPRSPKTLLTSESSESSSSEEEGVPSRDDLGPPTSETTLSQFYSKNKRVDERPVTCVLNKTSLKLYFSTMLGEGRLDREGRKELAKRYYLAPKQFRKLTLPTLQDTKLHVVEDMEFGLLTDKLLHSHR